MVNHSYNHFIEFIACGRNILYSYPCACTLYDLSTESTESTESNQSNDSIESNELIDMLTGKKELVYE